MRKTTTAFAMIVAAAAAASVAGCSPSAASGDGSTIDAALGWVAGPDYSGVYAAQELGYYTDAGLTVTITPGGPDVNAQQLVGAGSSQFGFDAASNVLAANDVGTDLVTIAQLSEKNALKLISLKESGIDGPDDWAGKRIGVFASVNSLYASLEKHGLDRDSDVTLVQQGFDMSQFLSGDIDLASAYSFDQLGQVITGGIPLSDLDVYDYTDDGTQTLEAQIFGNGEWVDAHPEQTAEFVAASIRGYAYCRDNVEECADFLIENGSTVGKESLMWQVNEYNAAVWPSVDGMGYLDRAAFENTAQILRDNDVITQEPDLDRLLQTDILDEALGRLDDIDLEGADYTPLTGLTP